MDRVDNGVAARTVGRGADLANKELKMMLFCCWVLATLSCLRKKNKEYENEVWKSF